MVSKALQNNAKSAKLSKGAPRHLWKRGGVVRPPRSPPLMSIHGYECMVWKRELLKHHWTRVNSWCVVEMVRIYNSWRFSLLHICSYYEFEETHRCVFRILQRAVQNNSICEVRY